MGGRFIFTKIGCGIIKGENYELKERTREREWKPFTWSLRAIRRALRVGILTKEDIIEKIVAGDVKFAA